MKPTVSFADFEKLDLRVGKILEATTSDWSTKLLELRIDFGPEIGQKTIFSGIRKWYKPEDLIGKSYFFLANLADKPMGKSVSQGMMLMADEVVNDQENPVLIEVDQKVKPGTVVR